MLTETHHLPTRRTGDVAKRVEILAADLIDLNAEGDARRPRLLEMGWPAAFLDQYEGAARTRANLLFVRDVNAEPVKSGRQLQDDMVDIIGSLFPATQFIVAELQARGFRKDAIDLHLRKAKARAALSFIHQGAH
ncbi:hypothetical protein [Devosia ginsengisoli]|uniref:hypothetical protein n=1 Tax=Devosia ginsengisoli TaxID=400770 RepID=UPI0026ECD03E|nr:hypothetical protein [Devosia ginsengisoli]MCR6672165.1 hypothetical protein [Devosia ginsengisoli]